MPGLTAAPQHCVRRLRLSTSAFKKFSKTWNWIGAVLFLPFATPVLGTILVFTIADLLGCNLTAAGPEVCMLFSLDIGERIYGYAIPLIGTIFTPIAFYNAMWEPALIWLVVFLVIRFQSYKAKIESGG